MATDEPGDSFELALLEALEAERARFAAFSALLIATADKHRRLRHLTHEITEALHEFDLAALKRLVRDADPDEFRAAFAAAAARFEENALLWAHASGIEPLSVWITPEEIGQRAPRDPWWAKRYRLFRAIEENGGYRRRKGAAVRNTNGRLDSSGGQLGNPIRDDLSAAGLLPDPLPGHSSFNSRGDGVGVTATRQTADHAPEGDDFLRDGGWFVVHPSQGVSQTGMSGRRDPLEYVDREKLKRRAEAQLGADADTVRDVYGGRNGGPLSTHLRAIRDDIDRKLASRIEDVAALADALGVPELERALQRGRERGGRSL